MKFKELKKMNKEKLSDVLASERSNLFVFKVKTSRGKAKNVKEGRGSRKTIARILTILNSPENKT